MQTPFIYGEKDVPNVHVFGRLLLNQLQSPWQKVLIWADTNTETLEWSREKTKN